MQQVAREKKSCLLEGEKVARNMKSCQKVAEQLVKSPIQILDLNTHYCLIKISSLSLPKHLISVPKWLAF